jgi:hypothetical protein
MHQERDMLFPSLSAGPEDVSKFFRHFSDLTFEERSA